MDLNLQNIEVHDLDFNQNENCLCLLEINSDKTYNTSYRHTKLQ